MSPEWYAQGHRRFWFNAGWSTFLSFASIYLVDGWIIVWLIFCAVLHLGLAALYYFGMKKMKRIEREMRRIRGTDHDRQG